MDKKILFPSFSIILILGILFVNSGCKKEKQEINEENFPAIRVILLNGCGYKGIAQKVRKKILRKNIDVISYGNAEKFVHKRTLIVVRQNDAEDLERLKRMTGIEYVVYACKPDTDAPFEIILGNDFEQFFN